MRGRMLVNNQNVRELLLQVTKQTREVDGLLVMRQGRQWLESCRVSSNDTRVSLWRKKSTENGWPEGQK